MSRNARRGAVALAVVATGVLALFLAGCAREQTMSGATKKATTTTSAQSMSGMDMLAKSDGAAQAVAPSGQKYCPVLGNPIDMQYYTDYQGQRIYFCCAGCIAAFNKDPEKYMKKYREQLAEPAEQ